MNKEDLPERLIPFSQVVALPWLPEGKRMSKPTYYRWISQGVRGHKLRATYSHLGLCTTERWLREFLDAAGNGAPTPAEAPKPTPASRERDIARAEAVLDAAGI